MLSDKDKNYIRANFLVAVKDGAKRSRIMALATALSAGEKDEEDAYYSVIHYFSNPKKAKELEKDYRKFVGGGSLPYIAEDQEVEKKR